MHRGYIKLWRKLQDNPIKLKPNCIALWIDLLIKANHKPNKIIWNNEELLVDQGQLLTGRLKLSTDTGLSEMQVRTALETLKLTSMITIKTYSKFSLISINNWCEYQEDNQQSNQQVTNKQPASNQQVTTNKNDKNDKNDKNNINTPAAYAADLPEEWKPIFISWLKYKQERGQKYKSKETAMVAYKNLVNLSGNDVIIAKKIVEQSIANNWHGLFALKNNGNNGGNNVKSKFQQSVEAGKRFLESYGVEKPNENIGAQMPFDS